MSKPLPDDDVVVVDPTENSFLYASCWETEQAKVTTVVFEQQCLSYVGCLLSPKMAALMNSGKLNVI